MKSTKNERENNNPFVLIIASLLTVGLLTSCDQECFFYSASDINNAEWNDTLGLEFDFSTNDTTSYLDFYLDIRNNEDYRYRNFYAFIEMEFPNGKTLMDTIHFANMATADGKWTGSGIGGSYDNSVLYKTGRKLPLPGEYRINVRQAMRDKTLVGIERVGVHIESRSVR